MVISSLWMDKHIIIYRYYIAAISSFACIIDPCDEEGMLRLAEGKSDREGRVEVCSNGVFATVCGKKWGKPDAVVVCKQLGHSEKSKTSSVPYTSTHLLIGALQIQA